MDELTRRNMEESKPKPEDFETTEDFEEAHGWWMSHQGRILALNQQAELETEDQPPSPEQQAMHEEYSAYLQRLIDSPTTTADQK